METGAQSIVNAWISKGYRIPKNIAVSDQTYFLPTIHQVQNEIMPKYWDWLRSLNLTKWYHRWDCDNFAEALKLFTCGYYQTTIEANAEGIGIGIIHYKAGARAEDGTGGGHAINVLFINNNNNIDIAFIEPQNGSILNLSKPELDSIWLLYL